MLGRRSWVTSADAWAPTGDATVPQAGAWVLQGDAWLLSLGPWVVQSHACMPLGSVVVHQEVSGLESANSSVLQ